MPCDPNLFPVSEMLDLETPILTDASPKDWRWGIYKQRNYEISTILQVAYEELNNVDLKKWSARIYSCAEWMKFRSTVDGLKLIQSNFCRVRVCPVCTARKADIWQARALEALPQIQQKFPASGYQFLFLTLTLKNCPIDQLRSHLKWMNNSFRKLTGNDGGNGFKIGKQWPGLGWIKSVEVTRNPVNNQAHPHIHCLMVVPKSYFESKNYITQKKWVSNWQECLRVDYKPLVSIMAVNNQTDELTNGLLEILKYEVKPSDLRGDWQWLAEYSQQVKGAKFINASGALREYFRFLEAPTDLVHGADHLLNEKLKLETQSLIQFNWDNKLQQFVCTESLN